MASDQPPQGHVDQQGADEHDRLPWQQRMLDNLWLLLVISVVVPGLLYLGWGLWELAELPTFGGR